MSKVSFSEDRYLQIVSSDATLFPPACLNMDESFQDFEADSVESQPQNAE